jgi:glycine/D-amino acid oxidase-like deaminating enzyme
LEMAERQFNWGESPWKVDFRPEAGKLPDEADVAVVGGGFTGLAAAAWLRRLDSSQRVVLLEAGRIGVGGSGRTGGIVLAETAVGDLPGLGDVLQGFSRVLNQLEIPCDLTLRGAWEIARTGTRANSPIAWQDSGPLRVANEVPGGTVDPGKLLSGLARAAHRLGVVICQNCPVHGIVPCKVTRVEIQGHRIHAHRVLLATNGQAAELTGMTRASQLKFTIAVATLPLKEEELEAIGLNERKPFYTLDLPYLWGRVLLDNSVIFGSGLVHLDSARELARVDICSGEAARLMTRLEQRVRRLHPALESVRFPHRWGGPILFTPSGRPFFARHPRRPEVVVLEGYCGQGVTLSVHLGCWAAEVLLGRREPPEWGGV